MKTPLKRVNTHFYAYIFNNYGKITIFNFKAKSVKIGPNVNDRWIIHFEHKMNQMPLI